MSWDCWLGFCPLCHNMRFRSYVTQQVAGNSTNKDLGLCGQSRKLQSVLLQTSAILEIGWRGINLEFHFCGIRRVRQQFYCPGLAGCPDGGVDLCVIS